MNGRHGGGRNDPARLARIRWCRHPPGELALDPLATLVAEERRSSHERSLVLGIRALRTLDQVHTILSVSS
jgi:hypothetical protein